MTRRISRFRGVLWREDSRSWEAIVVHPDGREWSCGRHQDELTAGMVADAERQRLLPWTPRDPAVWAAVRARDYSFAAWPSGEPYEWLGASRGSGPFDVMEHHVDLGAGRVKKARIGIDHKPAAGVDIVMGLDRVDLELPFADSTIDSYISHHFFEHCQHLTVLMDEVHRTLRPGGILRVICPLFPSRAAVEDPTHCRMIMAGTFDAFCGTPGDTPASCWLASFSVPYTTARFELLDKDVTPRCKPASHWGDLDVREIRVALRAMK